ASALHDTTAGNPLLIRRLADGLRGRGVSGAADTDAAAVATLGPDAVADAVAASLARLGDAPVRLAQAVAVLDSARVTIAARVAGLAHEATDAEADRLA